MTKEDSHQVIAGVGVWSSRRVNGWVALLATQRVLQGDGFTGALRCAAGLCKRSSRFIMAKPDVEGADLDQICTFNRLLHERNEISTKIELEENELQGLEDVEEELLLSTVDEDTEESPISEARPAEAGHRQAYRMVEIRIGGAFFALPDCYVEHYVAKRKEQMMASLAKRREERAAIIRTMTQLKQTLYSKFGDAINLEES